MRLRTPYFIAFVRVYRVPFVSSNSSASHHKSLLSAQLFVYQMNVPTARKSAKVFRFRDVQFASNAPVPKSHSGVYSHIDVLIVCSKDSTVSIQAKSPKLFHGRCLSRQTRVRSTKAQSEWEIHQARARKPVKEAKSNDKIEIQVS